MTEPDVASSDATNIRSRIEVSGDECVINGRKRWTSGAGDPRCKIGFAGKTDPMHPHHQVDGLGPNGHARDRHRTHADSYGYDDAPHGHAEITFTDEEYPQPT